MGDGHTPLLRARGVTRRFGGLFAVSDVSLDLAEGEIHAVIGTNGAGKSTLINVLAGEIPITKGSVELLGHDVTGWSQPRRAHAGLNRSYQRTTIFPRFSVFENCRLAAQATRQLPWNWWTPADACPVSTALAREALDRTGLSGLAKRTAGLLSHGEKRQLAIEVLWNTHPVASAIRQAKIESIDNCLQTGKAEGMVTFDESVRQLLKAGRISKATAEQNVSDTGLLYR